MKVNPIQNQPVQQQVNFKSRLPKVKLVKDDFWGEFTNNCIKENRLEELRGLLQSLTSNFDKNVLALRKYSFKTNNQKSKVDVFNFSLHKKASTLDDTTQLSEEVLVQNVYFDEAGTKLKRREYTNGVQVIPNETTTSSLLRVLKEIVTPNTKCNKAIYGDNDNVAEHFLKDFRA